MKKILVVAGHSPEDVRGCLFGGEGKLNVELVTLIVSNLSPYCELTVYPLERDLYEDVKDGCCELDLVDYDYIIEIHFNAYNGHARGTSIQIHADYTGGISVEQAIVNNVAAFGFKKRGENGIVRRDDLLIMNTCLELGVDHALLETCFGDNAEDMAIYQKNKSAIAKAISDGIIDAFGLVEIGTPARRGVVVNCFALNIRKTPNGEVIGTVSAGKHVTIIGSDPDFDGDMWSKVHYKNITGYVWPKYIDEK